MDDNKLIDINGLEVVYEDILTTLKNNYVKTSDVQDSKTVTPATFQQTVKPDTSKSLLEQVVVDAIPSKYKDTTGANAVQADVRSGKKFVNSSGSYTGTMPYASITAAGAGEAELGISFTNRKIKASITDGTFDGGSFNKTIKQGYLDEDDSIIDHSFVVSGSTEVDPESLDSNLVAENIVTGKSIFGVSGTFSKTTKGATPEDILEGKVAFVNGDNVPGRMLNIGKQTISLNTSRRSDSILKGYHDGTGIVSIPADYFPVNSTNTTATADDILQGKKVVGTDGNTITGNIANVSVTDPAPDLTLGELIDPSSRFLEIKPNSSNFPTIKALTPGYLGKGPFSADGFKNYIVVNPMDKAVVTLGGTATKGTANIAANSGLSDFTTTTPTDYYVELTTTSGSVIPDFGANTAGYIGSEYEMEGNITKISTDVPVDGNGSKIYFQVATLAAVKNAVNGSGQTTN